MIRNPSFSSPNLARSSIPSTPSPSRGRFPTTSQNTRLALLASYALSYIPSQLLFPLVLHLYLRGTRLTELALALCSITRDEWIADTCMHIPIRLGRRPSPILQLHRRVNDKDWDGQKIMNNAICNGRYNKIQEKSKEGERPTK